MGPLQKLILQKLAEGQWVFSLLENSLTKAFEKELGLASGSLSLLQLSLRRYLGLQLASKQSFPYFLNPADFQSEEDQKKFAETVQPNGRLGDWTYLEEQIVRSSFSDLKGKAPEAGSLVENTLSAFVRMKGSSFAGASMPSAYGAFLAGDQFFKLSRAEQMLSLVHELAHQELFLINLVDRLILEPADFNLSFAPYQGKARPPIGRLHSLYALFRMNQYCDQLGGDRAFLLYKLEQTKKSLAPSELTAFGLALVATITS